MKKSVIYLDNIREMVQYGVQHLYMRGFKVEKA